MARRLTQPPASQRRIIATLAAHERWADLDPAARREATAAARSAAEGRWLKLAREKYGDLPEEDLKRRADHLKSAHFARMALRSAQSRRRRSKGGGGSA